MIVHGHLHMPVDTEVRGTRVFSPGAVYIPEERDVSERTGLKGRAYLRFRRGLTPDDRASAVGLIEVGPEGMRARRVLLYRVDRTSTPMRTRTRPPRKRPGSA